MTEQEFRNKYVGKAVHCDTEEKVKELLKLAHDFGWKWNGGKWNDGDDLIKKTNWQKCQEHTCYVFNSDKTTIFGSYKFYKLADYEIVEFESEEKKEKKTKKVFDLGLFVDNEKQQGVSLDKTMNSIELWALECHGLTEEEMNKKNKIALDKWLKEVEVKVELTGHEIAVLEALKVLEFNWIARDKSGGLCAYGLEPIKNTFAYNALGLSYYLNKDLFTFITWLDEEPTSIDDLLKRK